MASTPPQEKKYDASAIDAAEDVSQGLVHDNEDDLQRRLGNRQIQLIAIGGSIGTALFVSIGGALNKGGPAGLFLAYTLYSFVIGMVNNCIAEMTVLQPVSGGFIRMAGKWVDDAFGFMAGWNFFFYEVGLAGLVGCATLSADLQTGSSDSI
jgi:yeast amino acid transporter